MSQTSSDCLITHCVEAPRPVRLTNEEETVQGRLSDICLDPCIFPPPNSSFRVNVQWYDSCLVHAIINALQRHDMLDRMLSEIRVVAKEEGLDRRDVSTGILCSKKLLGVSIKNGFDPDYNNIGIAHVYLMNGAGHYIGIRLIRKRLCIIDSLNGMVAPIRNMEMFLQRSTVYSIQDCIT